MLPLSIVYRLLSTIYEEEIEMKRFVGVPYGVLGLLMLALLLLAAQCGSAAPETPAAKEESAPAAEATEAPAEPAEEAAKATEAEEQKVVQESEISQAKDVAGTETITDEPDVSTPRTKLGGDYRDVSTSDAVSFHLYQTTDTGSSAYQGYVYSGSLITLDEKTLEYEPGVCLIGAAQRFGKFNGTSLGIVLVTGPPGVAGHHQYFINSFATQAGR